MSGPLTDFEIVEDHLLNAMLHAKRRCLRGEFTRDELVAILRAFDATLASVRALAMALPAPVRVREIVAADDSRDERGARP